MRTSMSTMSISSRATLRLKPIRGVKCGKKHSKRKEFIRLMSSYFTVVMGKSKDLFFPGYLM